MLYHIALDNVDETKFEKANSFNALLLNIDAELEDSTVDYDRVLLVNYDVDEPDEESPEGRVLDKDSWSSEVKKLFPFLFEQESAIEGNVMAATNA
ncbi:unnamed protein product [Haemonchus placei]|uniref:DUF1330 domain-containing protein n=1 Tax=Haemonchus placei TaxID=6290 RepID=A0A0N4W7M3_HAEPC|nr:unnamed protein product [Haemonchus placei]